MCEQCHRREAADKAMWLSIANAIGTVTNGLTGIANAIRKRYAETDDQRQGRRAA